jgi:hypothetical protein
VELVKAWDEEELAALKECVHLWLKRDSDWNAANAQMMYGLRFRRQFPADRLLAACKWFEEIPLTRWKAAISDAHIESPAFFHVRTLTWRSDFR